jgi:SAM-dependent methyltransferase
MPASSDPQPWDSIFRRDGRVFDSPAPVVHHVAEVLAERGCRRIVDLGCGSGRHTVFLAQRAFKVTGIDNSPTALSLSRQWLAQEGLPARLIRADMRRTLPLAEQVCDAVISTQVIHHALVATVQRTAREMARLLAPGGVVFVSVPARLEAGVTFREVEPGTYVPTSGSEVGLPHHIFSADGLAGLFPGFTVLELDLIDSRIWTLLAMRPAGEGSAPPAAGRPDGRPLSTLGERGIN